MSVWINQQMISMRLLAGSMLTLLPPCSQITAPLLSRPRPMLQFRHAAALVLATIFMQISRGRLCTCGDYGNDQQLISALIDPQNIWDAGFCEVLQCWVPWAAAGGS